MKKIILFGTPTWPGCAPVKELLSEKNINYTYIDVCESVGSLKKFLKVRDTSSAYEGVRERHSVGIPSMMIDDEVFLISSADLVNELIQKYDL